jgi:hypothetical protein
LKPGGVWLKRIFFEKKRTADRYFIITFPCITVLSPLENLTILIPAPLPDKLLTNLPSAPYTLNAA